MKPRLEWFFEALELAQSLAHRKGDFEAFCYFSPPRVIEDLVTGGGYSKFYNKLEEAVREIPKVDEDDSAGDDLAGML